MADIAASDVTITVQKRLKAGKRRRNRCKIAFGNGALTYPAGGVPLPAARSFGLNANVLEYLVITDGDDGTGLIWKYDQENKKLRVYYQEPTNATAGRVALLEGSGGATAIPATALYVEAIGW
jgi:hypothetical protein